MSDHTLPKTLDPFKYADQNRILEGEVALHLMPRLAEMLVDTNGRVEVKLEFDRDPQRLRILTGALSSTVNLMCQRCLHPVAQVIESKFLLGIVYNDEQAQNLPRVYEPLLVEDEKFVLLDMIEEELILSLPMFAYHTSCDMEDYDKADETEAALEELEEEKKPNPFEVLSGLKFKK
ncbi:MAG: hypothetical protein ACJAS1_001953 [Oleiphilaceae bacterium]|jgi:uncharacterized protein